ncbi:sce7725 family protein [Psychrobacter sp. APC 3350]|uniref:sce7725 family protein n=1 Tax=Psychrobacter sp. APC 3350 TaxID=3035195 RepID=UPI0025B55F5A|nr:sce7725 family protein [Psychrobacter sp. APC 3350]MDN3454670.1 sce7725 family protein [Psychrobacter sp. APC 3350]
MYYPYLRGRQFELIAIRDLALENSLEKVTPVIEPVKENFNSLNLANNIFFESGFKPFLIVNPSVGEVVGDTEHFLQYISKLENSMYKPAFHYSDNAEYILECIHKYELEESMIIGLDDFTKEDSLIELCSNNSVSHIMLLEPHRYRSLDRKIKDLNKIYIRLDDLFERQQKNADYLEIPAHKFSEEHLYYREDRYQGFGDFTVLSKEYLEGGSVPRAVVINLTYINEEMNDQIWIRHFTSDTNDSISNVQGKFAEATKKSVRFCDELPLKNSGTEELKKYYEELKYPGLGTVKKITIKNHLLVVKSYLDKIL